MTKSEEWDAKEKEQTAYYQKRDMNRVREIFFRSVQAYERTHKNKTGCNAVKINIGPDYKLSIFRCMICGHDFLEK